MIVLPMNFYLMVVFNVSTGEALRAQKVSMTGQRAGSLEGKIALPCIETSTCVENWFMCETARVVDLSIVLLQADCCKKDEDEDHEDE